MGHYVDYSPRYYKIIKVTPQKVKVRRLKHVLYEDGRNLPSTTMYGDVYTMTKRGTIQTAPHYGMICTRM